MATKRKVAPMRRKAKKQVSTLEKMYESMFKTKVPAFVADDASYSLKQPSPLRWYPTYTSTGANEAQITK